MGKPRHWKQGPLPEDFTPKPFGFCKVYVIAKVLTPLSAPGITFYVPVLKVPSAALARLAEFAAHEAPFEEPELWPLPAD